MFTLRILFIPSVCSQVPVIVICLPEPRGLSVEMLTSNRRFLIVFSLITTTLFTPPDILCQIIVSLLIYSIIELVIFVALVIQVREEGWTIRMRFDREKRMLFLEEKNVRLYFIKGEVKPMSVLIPRRVREMTNSYLVNCYRSFVLSL
jgi:Sec-independent protein translocase protein (TatC)